MSEEYDLGYGAGFRAAQKLLSAAEPVMTFGPLTFNRAKQTFGWNGRPFQLSRKRRDFLAALIPGRLATFEHLFQVVWPEGCESEDYVKLLTYHCCGVRRVLKAQGAPKDFILSEFEMGWKLNPKWGASCSLG